MLKEYMAKIQSLILIHLHFFTHHLLRILKDQFRLNEGVLSLIQQCVLVVESELSKRT
jgi:hypothetical protein